MTKKTILDCLRLNRYTSYIAAVLLLQRRGSYLKKVGWFNSFNKSMPVDKNGAAIPWYTYASIEFLKSRIHGEMTVFEYGSGNSTIWWAKRVSRVVCCEHDEKWFSRMKSRLPDNVKYMHVNSVPSEDYSSVILQYEKDFDIIAIDGDDRVNCARNCLCALNDTGVIIMDNSDRDEYRAGYDFLIDNGFRRLDFTGSGPIFHFGWCTSVFYRTRNCLGI